MSSLRYRASLYKYQRRNKAKSLTQNQSKVLDEDAKLIKAKMNIDEGGVAADGGNAPKNVPQGMTPSEEYSALRAVRSFTTLTAHILIGVVTGVSTIFAFRLGTPMTSTNLHLFLCVVGYQLVMAEAILCLAPDSWLSSMRLKHKRLVHWVLQIGGSVLAIAGSFVKIVDKSANNQGHWTTLHGQFALVALVFTSVSLANGLASLYAYELRKVIPGNLSKLTHICFGTVAFLTASVSLCYGFDKSSFRNWTTVHLHNVIVIITIVMTVIVIINPILSLFTKTRGILKR